MFIAVNHQNFLYNKEAKTSRNKLPKVLKFQMGLSISHPQCNKTIQRTTCLRKATGLMESEDAKHVSEQRVSDQFLKDKRRA